MSKLDDDLKVPYVAAELVDYLKAVFNPDNLLNRQTSSAETLVGYMQGCRDVITHLQMLREAKEDD